MNRRDFLEAGVVTAGLLAGCGQTPDGETPSSESPSTTTDAAGTTVTESPGPTTADPGVTTTSRTTTATTTTTTTKTSRTTTRPVGRGIGNPSFEDGLTDWTVGRDLPEDPNDPGNRVASEATTSTRFALGGKRSLSLYIDGRQDDGTLWVQQRSDLTGAEVLKVDVFSPSESFNTITKVAAYAGPVRTLSEGHFDTGQPVENHEGWRTYTYPVEHDGVGLVAVGISVVWETKVTRFLDDVTLVYSE